LHRILEFRILAFRPPDTDGSGSTPVRPLEIARQGTASSGSAGVRILQAGHCPVSWTMPDRSQRRTSGCKPLAGPSRGACRRAIAPENAQKRRAERWVAVCRYWIMAAPQCPTSGCNTYLKRRIRGWNRKARKFNELAGATQRLLGILQHLLFGPQRLLGDLQRLLDDLQRLLGMLQRLQGRFASCERATIALYRAGILLLTYRYGTVNPRSAAWRPR